MHSKNEISLMRKVLYCILFLLGVFYYFGISSQSVARALVSSVDAVGSRTQAGFEQGEALSTFKKFAVIGDYGYAGQPEADVAALIKSWNPDFIVTVGDNNYYDGAASTIDANIGQYFHEFIYPYAGAYGPGASVNKFFPVLGNHDWRQPNAQPYLNYFSLPGNERYYDFVQGPLHFFMLDSDGLEPDGNTATSTQAGWLQNALSASTAPWKIVVLHHAPYSSGEQGSSANLQWPYAEWGASVVLAGHDHTYERIVKNGFPYFVNGLGGRNIYTFGTAVSGSKLRYNKDYGAMLVESTEAYIYFQFITRQGVVIDSYTLGTIPPVLVDSIVDIDRNPSHAATVNFQVTFSEPVSGVDINDFAITKTGDVSNATVSGVSGLGRDYTVAVNTGTGDGTIRLDVPVTATIKNLSERSLTGLPFLEGQIYTMSWPPVLQAPILRSPETNTITNITVPNFLWTRVRDGETYLIQFASNNTFTNIVASKTLNETAYTVTVPFNDGNYFWRVRAYNASNQSGAWSSTRTFTIDTSGPATPVLSSPTHNSNTRMPIFRWVTVPGAVLYEFQYDDDSGFVDSLYTITLRGTFRRPPAMRLGTYYWHVRAKDAAGNWGAWSAPFIVNITNP